jgi:hypothetical protein
MSEQDTRSALSNFKVSLSEFITSLENTKDKIEKMKLPQSCQCEHCKMHLENLELRSIPLLNGQIAAVRGTILLLKDQIDD